jgi:hypothetical protein
MTNIEIIQDYNGIEHAVITQLDGSFTSMSKSTYDAQQAAMNDISK